MKVLDLIASSVLTITLQAWSPSAQAALDIQHWTTAQGTEVYFVENHDLPIVDVSVNFPAGQAHDTVETSGVAALTHYLMTLGAGGLNEETITNRFADIGAILGGSFDADRASFKLRTLTSEQEKALETFTTLLHRPDFPAVVLEREKSRVIAGIQEAEIEPDSIAKKTFMQAVYGMHPYSQDESGEVATIQSAQTADLRTFYEQHYAAKSAVIAMMGDLSVAQAHAIAEKLSDGLPQTHAVPPIAPVKPLRAPVMKQLPHPATQAHILLGQPGNKRGDPDFFPLYVGNYILGGGGFVSRLTEEVREKRGLAYTVYSYFMPMAELGPFQIGLQTKKEQAQEALQLVNATVRQFVEKGVTAQELQAAKDNLIGGFPLRIDSNNKILEYLNVIGFYKLPLDYLDSFNDNVRKVTAQQIHDAFQRRVQPENFVTVIVGAEE
ncbi:M16 family metallopeptidase [Methylophilus aquaticus]|uniref:Pitrilysin family protein n=1 Tax=Methylophilus aquaticus TaxID=1971610 RepID=A0ABT9JQH1_9PROT|nr:pitrilysin family protein [Methylophilus aquaticus]MDP8566806.1 pitrilysin family protein [Methylophilus aquaticus]